MPLVGENKVGTNPVKRENNLLLNLLLCFALAAVLIFHLFNVLFFKEEKALIFASVFATGTVFYGAVRSLKNRRISIDMLASIALAVSIIKGEWLSAVFINLMIAFARASLDYVKAKSHSAISKLLKLKPKKVKIKKDGRVEDVSIKDVKKGDKVIIELGEMVPVDGLIEEGEALVDQSSLTGESVPVAKKTGDKILSFTIVVSGNLVIRAEKVGQETTFEKIISLIEESQLNKAPIHSLTDKFSNWYIIFIIVGSLLVYLFSRNTDLVLALLLVSCADDIAVATPLALMSAITKSAKNGVIIRGGDYLEALSNLKTIVFDKTGTLTKGKFKIEKIYPFNGNNENEVLRIASAGSFFSTHPIAKAIIHFAKENKISSAEPEKFQEYGGRGTIAIFNGDEIIIGNLSFFQDMKIYPSAEQINKINEGISKGYNISLVGRNKKLIGFITLADELRTSAKKTIEELKNLGIEKIVMLTGDNKKIAENISKELGIDEFHAGLLPEEKISRLKNYLNKKYKVAMVGDGVNDAPVLALADIGIAMGAIGSDAAIETADIALMKDDLSKIPAVIKISRFVINVIRQNILLWVALNILGFILVFSHVLTPSGAAMYNFFTDFAPIINSLRLFK